VISGPAIKATTVFHRMEAALCEVGRSDLAAQMTRWSSGRPNVWSLVNRNPDDLDVIAKAVYLADPRRRELFDTLQDYAGDLRRVTPGIAS